MATAHQGEIHLSVKMLQTILALPSSYTLLAVEKQGQEVVILVESEEIPDTAPDPRLPLIYPLYRRGEDGMVCVMDDRAIILPGKWEKEQEEA